MRGLKDKVAVVCGGATGIGAATAKRLAAEGALVVVGDIEIAAAKATADAIESQGGRAIAAAFDIIDDASVARLFAAAVASFGHVDHVHVNAADLGIAQRDTDALTVPLDVFDRTIAVNLRGHLLCTRHALPLLLQRGGGAIVYTSSGSAFAGEPERVAYAISKSGLNALMRHVASRWGKEGIRSNAIAPGLIVTEKMQSAGADALMAYALEIGRSPRLGTPDDIAAMTTFLMSDDGEWINGQVIGVDGGILMR